MINKGCVLSDVGSSCFNHADKASEFDETLAGLRFQHRPLMSDGYGFGVLTGRKMWAYSGVGSALEMKLEDGRIGWFTEARASEDVHAELLKRRSKVFSPVTNSEAAAPQIPAGSVFFGVAIPEDVTVFDCRNDEKAELPRARKRYDKDAALSDYEAVLWASERAGYALWGADCGWRSSGSTSLQCHFDTREPGTAMETRRILLSIIETARNQQKEYLACPAERDGQGGGCHYRVAGVALCNFGASVVSDNVDYRVRRYEG